MLSPHINAKHQDSLQQGWAGRKAVVVHPVPATTASEQPAPRKNREKDTCQGKKSSHINTLKICLLQDMTSILMDQEYINLFLKTCINLSKDAILLLVLLMQLHGTVFIIWAAYSYAMTDHLHLFFHPGICYLSKCIPKTLYDEVLQFIPTLLWNQVPKSIRNFC